MPSWVAFGDEEILVGEAARDAFQSNPENTVFDVARLLGRNMHDEGFQEDMKHWLFKVREKDGKPVINVQYRRESRDFAPEEIVGMVMSEIKMMAEAYLGQKITHAVLTVPAGADFAGISNGLVLTLSFHRLRRCTAPSDERRCRSCRSKGVACY
jgi:heat shock protein 5